MVSLFFIPILFVIAFVYAGVGLGGGTAYLALLAFQTTDPLLIRPIAWCLNIIAAGLGFRNYWKAGYFDLKTSIPYLIPGIIGAVVGARIDISLYIFEFILGFCLLGVGILMISQTLKPQETEGVPVNNPRILLAAFFSLVIGIFSGIVGIGGGIILGPLILLFRWSPMKQVSAITSAYICLSSAGALISFLLEGHRFDPSTAYTMGIAVLVGGFLGSWYGAFKASPRLIKLVFGIFVILAAIKVLAGVIAL